METWWMTILIAVGTGLASSFSTWFFSKKQYNSQVENQDIANIDVAADVWKKIIDNLKQIDKEIRSYISRRLQEAIDKKYIEVDDVEITAFLIYKMYIALMFEWSDTKIDKQKMADTIIKILRDGLERKKDVKDE